MSTDTASFVVSEKTFTEVREFVEDQGLTDLSGFVEDAVKAHMFQLAAAKAKVMNISRSPEEVETAVDEALQWSRGR